MSTEGPSNEDLEAAEAERRLGRGLAIGIPAVSVAAATVVGVVASAGPAILVLVGGAILGGIALLWASLRTLGGDAPLSEDMEALAVRTVGREDLAARKLTVLRALKDLKHEHEIGKIDDADYEALEAKYRSEAKDLLRALDTEVEPFRAKAEALAEAHLRKAGLAGEAAADTTSEPKVIDYARAVGALRDDVSGEAAAPTRVSCPKCSTMNDPDAAFCKKCGTALPQSATVETEEAPRA